MAGQGANDDGTSLVLGVFPLFAAGEERVQVHVGDPAVWVLRASHVLLGISHSGIRYIVMYEKGDRFIYCGQTELFVCR
jgi:hypothetical protein